MAQDTSLEGLRRQLITEKHGRRLGLGPGNSSDQDPQGYLMGIKAVREAIEGFSSGGTTITSTAVANKLSPFGISIVGATGASATTAYLLAAPVPGVEKKIFNPTTGAVTILTTDSGAFICSTGSAGSTYGSLSFVGKGAYATLWGLTTSLWGLAENLAITTVTTGNLVQLV